MLSPASTVVTSGQLWTQIKDASQKDIEKIADAAASTALSQAKTYTDTKLSEFITISYKGPYDSYAALLADNVDGGKAGVIYLVIIIIMIMTVMIQQIAIYLMSTFGLHVKMAGNLALRKLVIQMSS